jgi:hypothetical protein
MLKKYMKNKKKKMIRNKKKLKSYLKNKKKREKAI